MCIQQTSFKKISGVLKVRAKVYDTFFFFFFFVSPVQSFGRSQSEKVWVSAAALLASLLV